MLSSLRDQLVKEHIQFSFNPLSAPHFGGSWEREMRSVKTAFRTTLGVQTSKEVLMTILIEVENILNSRPLGYISSDVAEADPVTPNSLLMGRPDSSLYQVVQYMTIVTCSAEKGGDISDHFWKHWYTIFCQSCSYGKNGTERRKALHLVLPYSLLMNSCQECSGEWELFSSVIPSSDGRVQAAVVKVKNQLYSRPETKLIELPLLPLDSENSS